MDRYIMIPIRPLSYMGRLGFVGQRERNYSQDSGIKRYK
jgi:hypothetical protein